MLALGAIQSIRAKGAAVHISKKTDYALRAVLELAVSPDRLCRGEEIARTQNIPAKFLENILFDLKRADIVTTQRGVGGGYRLARTPETISLADVVRAIDGPLVTVHGLRPDVVEYNGAANCLRDVWIAVRVNLRDVLETVTLADLTCGTLPSEIQELLQRPDARSRH